MKVILKLCAIWVYLPIFNLYLCLYLHPRIYGGVFSTGSSCISACSFLALDAILKVATLPLTEQMALLD